MVQLNRQARPEIGFARVGPAAPGHTRVSLNQSEPAQPVRAGQGQGQARTGTGPDCGIQPTGPRSASQGQLQFLIRSEIRPASKRDVRYRASFEGLLIP